MRTRVALTLTFLTLIAGCSGSGGNDSEPTDPGSAPWAPVARERVAEECGLDPDLLAQADARLGHPWAAVRYGKLCHEFYPNGDRRTEVYSATKTLGALVTGVAAWETRNLRRTGRKTGPLLDDDRVDHWLDAFSFNQHARIAHVLAMVGHNRDLRFGAKLFVYDALGTVQINRLSDVVNIAIAQDPGRLGANIEEFTQRFLFGPLGMRDSSWSGGRPDKIYAYSWETTVRDMARVGLLLLRDGMWSGRRIVGADWVYKMTRPAFEDASTSYAYLTWLNSRSNWPAGPGNKGQGLLEPCSPAALWASYPHGISESPDCHYHPPYTCAQRYDVGVWNASGAGGQYIIGHRGLDLVLVAKDSGIFARPGDVWDAMRPALVAHDPTYAGDEAAFCAAYEENEYAPDLR